MIDPYVQSGSAAGPSTPMSAPPPRRKGIKRYHAHPGCTLCSIVAGIPGDSASDTRSSDEASPTARTGSLPISNAGGYPPEPAVSGTQGDQSDYRESGVVEVAGREVVYYDEEITIVRAAGKERLCANGRHLIVILNKHLTDVYQLGPGDVPTLSSVLEKARQSLARIYGNSDVEKGQGVDIRVGFVGSMIRDPQSSHEHLHAHAMAGPMDTKLPGSTFYRRNVIFGSLNWWSVEDLRAEIRESTSNNRIKSGYTDRKAPIDKVPDAGSRDGPPNALEDDPYLDSPTMPRSRLHARDVFDVSIDRKGKAPMTSRSQQPAVFRGERDGSTTSVGSIRDGEGSGYVPVDV